MLALVLAMLFCVTVGAGVVGYVMLEARREGRGEFWTAEGEELIAGARRTGEKVRNRGEQLRRSTAARTRDLAARLPEVGASRQAPVGTTAGTTNAIAGATTGPAPERVLAGPEVHDDAHGPRGAVVERADGYRAAS